MQKLNVGTVQIPINAATKTFAILAKRGAGKTYTGAVMAEEFAKANVPFVVIDPIDVWWGLRLAANGKDKGLPVVVFGVQHEDILLDRDMGRKIAQAVVRENVSCVINTFGLPKAAQRHLLAEFADELLNINNTPRHIFIEEAHEFLPQRVFGGLGVVFNAVSNLVIMGRNRGIGVTLINQRAATINKDVLTQIDTLLAFQNTSPQDRKALADWVEFHSAEGDFKKFMASLPSLPKGEGWIWSPEFMEVFEKIKIRKRETFHPDRERLGDTFVMPELDRIDVRSFIAKFTSDTKVGKKKGSKEPSSITENTEATDTTIRISLDTTEMLRKEIERKLTNEFESKLIEKDAEIRKLQTVINNVRTVIGEGETTSMATPNTSAVQMWLSKLGNGGTHNILAFLASRPNEGFTRQQIALAIGASYSSVKNVWVPKLKRNLLVKEAGDRISINPDL